MCGITGFMHFDGQRRADEFLLRRMTSTIRHRGPDGEGYFLDRNVALGHRRLSIIDLNTGDQPMYNPAGTIAIILNGEIYNYLELKDELEKKGHSFRTTSDTEVILVAYQEWGIDCQQKLNGMWAFAIWDQEKNRLFLSRDRIGEKPLYYAIWDNTLVFGSEIQSLTEYGIPKHPRSDLIEMYLVLSNIPGPYSFYKNIEKLLPGHFILADNHGHSVRKFWDFPQGDGSEMETDRERVLEEFTALFTDAVRIRTRADVPFGVFLSGGLDSSSIVSVMSQVSTPPVKTFTIGFDVKDYDESALALLVSKKFGTEHHVARVDFPSFTEMLDQTALYFGEPFGGSSAIPTGLVSKMARQEVKMVLTGDGGDEALSGYNTYLGIELGNLLQRTGMDFLGNFLLRVLSPLGPVAGNRFRYRMNQVDNYFRTIKYDFMTRTIMKHAYAPLPLIKKLSQGITAMVPIESYFSDLLQQCTYRDDFYKQMFINYKHDLPNDYLVKVDRMSMSHALETRAPFLDYRLIEFMSKVDKKIKLRHWERKSVLRDTIGRTLPPELLKARKKGFVFPVREWFKSLSVEEFRSDYKKIREILDPEVLDQVFLDNKTSRYDYGQFLWSLVILNKSLT